MIHEIALINETRSNSKGFTLYKRRNTMNGGFKTSVKMIMIMINGSDQAMFIIDNKNKNEIEDYQTVRYINTQLNSNEAIWRILGFHIHEYES
ncbi:Uncharacterized protein FWK35_00012677 [Aphis craccivora]|uniref:Uncharacterized protein n=1 Tax=Aphis craccivora TaxID=307492 RepID=A0A6G0YIU4_APHCR|nr:Uncharacterized protein FWK35_00012677 [Aphis craccivora]